TENNTYKLQALLYYPLRRITPSSPAVFAESNCVKWSAATYTIERSKKCQVQLFVIAFSQILHRLPPMWYVMIAFKRPIPIAMLGNIKAY
ncbi:hypothetical protein, partial [Teredinibacter waterburyi]|uniref:hypothetical protein n=1 Tax=Teredinibacter waterburyi TaxID=1500538 RepID=UPI001CAA89FF